MRQWLHVLYGQRTEAREHRAFLEIATFFGARHSLVTRVGHLRQIGGSSLTDPAIQVADANLDSKDIPTSYVPFRNAHMLAIATSWAEVIGAGKIYIGAVEEDSSGYPDCRQVFFDLFNQLIHAGTKPGNTMEIVTPLIDKSKADIVKAGMDLGAPFHLTWSCYRNQEQACGNCDSCALRLRGFRTAGYADPIVYAPGASENG